MRSLFKKQLGLAAAAVMSLALALLVAGAVHAAPAQWSVNGHWYEAIEGGITWDGANAAAMSSTFNGMPGHLATITSAGENAFISALLPSPVYYILGGLQDPAATTFGVGWGWVTGEAFVYTNWATPIEPNDGNDGSEAVGPGDEDRLHFFDIPRADGLTWNDYPGGPTDGYVVEYEINAAIPEPEIYAMLAAGLGLMGWAARRRKRQLAAA